MTWRSGGATKEAAVTTTPAPSTASRADAATRTSPIPRVSRATAASASARTGSRSNTREHDARQDVAQDRDVAPPLDAGPDQRRARHASPGDAAARRPGSRRR